MAKASLQQRAQDKPAEPEEALANAGPFVTISRQFGCYGFSLGLLLLEILNEEIEADEKPWKVYHKEILQNLATETDMAAELLESERRSKPRLIVDFFRSLSGKRIPSGHEIRSRITTIIRGLALDGRAIIIGQGGAGATRDLPNGLSVRLEGPEKWRIRQIALREGLTEAQARARMLEMESEREYLRKLYEAKFPQTPGFSLVYDCSAFTLAQIAQHVVRAMQLKDCV